MKLSIVAVLILLCSWSLPAEDMDISGEWDITFQTPRGEVTRTYAFEQSGSELTITTQNRDGEEVTFTGTLTGDTITWTQTRPMRGRGGEITVTYSGTVTGDTMAGTMDMDGRRSQEWSAHRTEVENK